MASVKTSDEAKEQVRERDEKLTKLLDSLELPGEHRVGLVGSTFGGTGSGGVPAFSRYIGGVAKEAPGTIGIGAVAFLPWFQLGRPPEEARKKGLSGITNEEMLRNAQTSVAYFKGDLGKFVHKLILVGLGGDLPMREWTGSTGQPEHKHYLSLLAAHLLHEEIFQKPINRNRNEIFESPTNGIPPLGLGNVRWLH